MNIVDEQREDREKPAQRNGVLVLHKPKGPTSAACIGKIKRVLGQKKIGHAGTLDPMAEGVLLVLLGQATKIAGWLTADESDKIYSGVIRLGVITDTWDTAGKVLEERPAGHITQADVAKAFASFMGVQEQEVPAYSAAKHQGKPLYALAREGKPVPVKTKTVTVTSGEAELVGLARIRFRVACSSGTYIRSLAHSLGNRLGCGAALEELIREYSRPFSLSDAHSLEDVLCDKEGFARKVKSIAEALPDLPKLLLTEQEEALVRNGIHLVYAGPDPFTPGVRVLLCGQDGTPLALSETALHTGGEGSGRPVRRILRGLWNPESFGAS